jgi:hypothetical protein
MSRKLAETDPVTRRWALEWDFFFKAAQSLMPKLPVIEGTNVHYVHRPFHFAGKAWRISHMIVSKLDWSKII